MSSSSLRGARPTAFWLEDPARPEVAPSLRGSVSADLAIVGGGYLGLWTALLAKDRNPDLDVLIVEGLTCGHAASGRNGGFCEASLTHGFGNGMSRWPDEMATLLEMGRANLNAIEATITAEEIDCDFVRSGVLAVATEPHHVEILEDEIVQLQQMGQHAVFLDAEQTRQRVDSPTYLASIYEPDVALVEPARLAWGLREACLRRGVRIHERTPVRDIASDANGVRLRCRDAVIAAKQVVLATNAYRPLLKRLRLMTVPVYDYALMTEPLTTEQRAAIGWLGREGISDTANQFHYYRTTRDGRILWGGYDAIYHYGSAMRPDLEQRPATFELLADQFFATFPQLEGLNFTHAWGGVIDTCTRFTAFYGTAMRGRVGYALGFTGLGVGATRFAGDVVLDLLGGLETERTALQMVREKPLPFPPEPIRYLGIEATRRSLAAADLNGGKENLWLRATGAVGLGFDS